MFKQMLMAGGLLAAAVLTGCAEFREERDPVDSNPAVAAGFRGNWNIQRQVFRNGKPAVTENGTAVCEMLGKTARISSAGLKLEIIFGIRQDGEYALVDVNASRDRMLIGRDTDEEEEDGDAVEMNDDLNLKFGRGLFGEIKFLGKDSIEISYFYEHDDRERLVERLLLTRMK